MAIEFPIITTNQYQTESTKWLQILNRGEDLSVLFIPKTDREIRMGQFMNDKGLLKRVLGRKNPFIFVRVNFDAHDVEDIDDFFFQVQDHLTIAKVHGKFSSFDELVKYLRQNNFVLVLIMPECEKYLNQEGRTALTAVTEAIENYSPYIRVMSFFEADLTHPSLLQFLPSSSKLYENAIHFPLYNYEDTMRFIQLLENQWHTIVKEKYKKIIYEQCGGHFWLVKEAVRKITNNEKWSSTDESTLFRLRSIYNLMQSSEQRALKKIVRLNKELIEDERVSMEYLKRMRVIDKKNHLLLGAFEHLLLEQPEQEVKFVLEEHKVLLNQIPINRMFSKKEYRVIKLLLKKKGLLVSRDELASVIWPIKTEEHFSDWAIDQLITRVRKRLREMSLSPSLIQVIRGKGYKLDLGQRVKYL